MTMMKMMTVRRILLKILQMMIERRIDGDDEVVGYKGDNYYHRNDKEDDKNDQDNVDEYYANSAADEDGRMIV